MGLDFCGCGFEKDKCMACEIVQKSYIPPGEILYENGEYIIHQDPLVAIPGFLIVSPKRHIYSIDEMTISEKYFLGYMLSMAEDAIKTTTKITYISIIQEDYVSDGHLHIWVFPWHKYIIDLYGFSLNNLRKILSQYKIDLRYAGETLRVATEIKLFFLHKNEGDNGTNYAGLNLCDQDFSGQNLNHADFRGAILKRCIFDGCDLSFANFDDADLYKSSFCSSTLYSATFRGADLTRTNFRNANLYGVKIFGSDLSHTMFDETSIEEKNHEYSKAEDIYNTIKRAYSENGNKEESARYYYKQCVAKRKQKNVFIRFFEWLLADLLIGYGERLGRCFVICLLIMSLFAGYYFVSSGFSNLIEAIITSVSVFFGFDPIGSLGKMENLNTVFSLERLVGYFLIALALIGVARKIVRD